MRQVQGVPVEVVDFVLGCFLTAIEGMRDLGARLRGSGTAARWCGVIVQLVLVGAIALGLVNSGSSQSFADRSLMPVTAVLAVCLLVLALRTLFVGVYFSPDRLVIRTWLRTYTVRLDSAARCDSLPWRSWIITGGVESSIMRMLSFTWTEAGRRTTRNFPVTMAGRNHARRQAAVINAYVAAARSQPSPELARDYAHGPAWRAVTSNARTQQKRSAVTTWAWLGLARYPDPPRPDNDLQP